MRARACLLLGALFLVGCVDEPRIDGARPFDRDEGRLARPVVIALIDSGTNPYLDAVQNEGALDTAFAGETHHVVLSSSGDLTARLEQDSEFWESVLPQTLYHFEGTRLLAISFTDVYPRRLFDSEAHGASVTQIAARHAPNAVIVVAQVSGDGCLPRDTCLFDPSVSAAMEWAAAQPWIDIISTSLGFPGNPPDDPALHDDMRRWLDATRAASASGKIVVSAAGNQVSPSLGDYHAGPPWVIAVGGAEAQGAGDALAASKAVDVVADYSTTIQGGMLDGSTRIIRGTSFAAPAVAGTVADALSTLRARGASPSPAELREALNASALLVSPTGWRPAPPDGSWLEAGPALSAPALTPAQTGWGYVNSSLAPEIARRVLENDLAPPPEKAQTALFQEQWQRAREEYWARYGS